jgi:hypothetical protein
MPVKAPIHMTLAEWLAEGEKRFGPDKMKWRFECPSCHHVASIQDYKDAGAKENAVAFSCIGRYLPKAAEAFGGKGTGPCNYTGGGLIGLNPVHVRDEEGRDHHMFAYAEEDAPDAD